MRDVPHYINRKMKGHIRRWHKVTETDDKKRKGSGQTPPRGKRGAYKAASAMGGGPGAGAGGTRSKWGQMPAGGWTPEQQERWDAEEQARKTRAAEMHNRVEREEEELKHRLGSREAGAVQQRAKSAARRAGAFGKAPAIC
jgi:hypothetical protein